MKKLSISLCMIVKNEEFSIIRCLNSIKNIADEIIIVDTGSVDNTIEIAKDFGAKVIEHPWQNNFSDARNVSLEHAHGDWILFLDADEEVMAEDLHRFEILESTDRDGFFLVILNLDEKGGHTRQQSLRLFKNQCEYRFQGAIHEQIMQSIINHNPSARFGSLNIRIKHYGYLNEQVSRHNKVYRNISMLQHELIKEKNNGFLYFSLGNEYMRMGDYAKALQYYNMAENFTAAEVSYAPLLGKKKSQALINRKLYQEALGVLKNYLKIYPDYTDLLFLKAGVYYKTGQHQQSLSLFKRCLLLGEAPACYVSESGVGTYKAEQAIRKVSASMNKSGISLCMIVFNEENNLPRCLNSAKDVVDEIIIVDTGSTDSTVQIANNFGAKVYHFDWSGDFAEARNYSLKFATCPWVLVLDADEMLRPCEHQRLREAVGVTGTTMGYYLKIINYFGRGDAEQYVVDAVCRLFRNSKEFSFSGRIHEEISQSIISRHGLKSISPLDVHIDHRGYIEQPGLNNKNQRNIGILKKQLKQDPEDAYALYALGTEYFQQGDYNNALVQYYKALRLIDGKDVMSDLFFKIAVCHLELKEYQKGLQIIEQGQQLFAHFTPLWYLQGLIEYKQNQLTQACRTWEKTLSMGDPPWHRYTFPHGIGGFITAAALGGCYEKMGLLDKAESLLEKYLIKGKGVRAVTPIYCRILLKKYQANECLAKLERLNYPRCFKESIILARVFSQLDNVELEHIYFRKSLDLLRNQPNQGDYLQLIALKLKSIDKYCGYGMKLGDQSPLLSRLKSKLISLRKEDNKNICPK